MNNTTLPLIASQMLNTPLLLEPHKAEVLMSVFGKRIGVDTVSVEELAAQPEMSAFIGSSRAGGAYRVKDGAAIVPIHGTLVNRGAWIGSSSGLTSYDGIMQSLKLAVQDTEVDKIILDINTPGGEAAGMTQLASFIREIRAEKPVIAVVNDLAASGGYAIAAQANEILVSETSRVGSIGVILVHVDQSVAIEAAGIKPTIIQAGKHKADGNPFEPLPENVRGVIQEGVNDIYNLFVDLVVAGRPSLSIEDVKSTEAQVYMGKTAIKLGLADGFGTVEDAVSAALDKSVIDSSSSSTKATGDKATMSDVTEEHKGAEAVDHRADGEAAMKLRIKTIMNSPEAKGREEQANHLAFDTSMPADEAITLLSKAPKPEADSKADKNDNAAKAAALAAEAAVSVVGEDGGGGEVDAATARSNRMKAAGKMASSFKR